MLSLLNRNLVWDRIRWGEATPITRTGFDTIETAFKLVEDVLKVIIILTHARNWGDNATIVLSISSQEPHCASSEYQASAMRNSDLSCLGPKTFKHSCELSVSHQSSRPSQFLLFEKKAITFCTLWFRSLCGISPRYTRFGAGVSRRRKWMGELSVSPTRYHYGTRCLWPLLIWCSMSRWRGVWARWGIYFMNFLFTLNLTL